MNFQLSCFWNNLCIDGHASLCLSFKDQFAGSDCASSLGHFTLALRVSLEAIPSGLQDIACWLEAIAIACRLEAIAISC